jgi:hypothetical protein
LDKLVQQTWTDFDDQYDPPETLTDPMDIALDKAEKKARLREGILAKYGAVKPVAPADAATAQNITAPGAMGGVPKSVVPGMPGFGGDKPDVPPVDGGDSDAEVDVSDEITSTDLTIPGNADYLAREAREGRLSFDAHKKVLKKLEDAVKNPQGFKNLDMESARTARARMQHAYEEVRDNFAIRQSLEKDIKPAWTKAKTELEKAVDAYAKKVGEAPETIWRTVAKGRPIPKFDDKGLYKGDAFIGVELLGDKLNEPNPHLSKVGDQLARYRNQQNPVSARLSRLFGGEQYLNSDVLRKLAEEKVAAMDGGGNVEGATRTPKIVIGTPKPVP